MRRFLLPAVLAFAPLAAAASCGSAFCTMNTSWDAHGAWLEPGARLDLRYESIRQDQPRTGTRNIGVGEIPRDHDEVLTRNRNLLGTLDYTFDENWGVNVLVPIVDRHHDHLHNDAGGPVPQSWDFTELGDVRVLARRRLSTTENAEAPSLATSGIDFGLKLPTGRTDVRNADGELAERTLQPGSGTTDAVLGAYYSQHLPTRNLAWFVQGLAQLPVNSHDEYRPGNRLGLDLGARYDIGDRLGVLLQLNTLFKARDRGAQAEPEDTGGKFVFLSPGLSYAFSQRLQAYTFVQLPVYQHVNGVQLVPRYAFAVGINSRF
jgi:outer membrane putative beta-barrel porin/alpha-amylase